MTSEGPELPDLPEALSAWVRRVDAGWRRAGIADPVRLEMRADLLQDLAKALNAGASVDELTDTDPADFALEVAGRAVAGPLRGGDHTLSATRLAVTGTVGAVLGAALSYVTVYPVTDTIILGSDLLLRYEVVFTLLAHVVAGALCLATAAAALWTQYHRHRHARRIVIAATGSLLVAGILSIWPTVLLAGASGFSTDAGIVVTELALVVVFCATGLGLSRGLVLPRSTGRVTTGDR